MMKSFLIFILTGLFFAGCTNSNKQSDQTKKERTSKDSLKNKTYSFALGYRTPFQDTVYVDSTALKITIDPDGQTSGTYRWVLPQKDGKLGKIAGMLSGDTVNGHYHYQQEGGEYTDSIQIILQPEQAIVIQFNAPGHQLIDTLPGTNVH